MTKYNDDLLNHLSAKYLGYMTLDAKKEVEITDQGFVYKGELIVSLPGLKDLLTVKEAPAKVEKKVEEEPKKEEVKEETSEEEKSEEEETEEKKEEVSTPVVSKKRPRKTK